MTLRQIPLKFLIANPDNPRRVAASSAEDAGLMASIKAHGLLQPLLVHEAEPGKSTHMVIDGHRRLKALQELDAEGALGIDDSGIPCTVRPWEAGIGNKTELATAANMLRADMHPLDECEAIATLIGEDAVADIESLAARFGASPHWVKQRLKLAGLGKRARQLFRDGLIGLPSAMALTLGSEEQQEKYLKGAREGDWKLEAKHIRNAFTEKKIPGSRAFFDLKLYPQDAIQRDLFSNDVWLLDKAAFDKLQKAAYQETVAELREAGWGEVIEVKPDAWYEATGKHVKAEGRIRKADRAKLSCFIQMAPDGTIRLETGYAQRKQAAKVTKNGVHAEDTTTVEAVKPVSPTDLTKPQTEAMASMMGLAIEEQCLAYDTVALWTLIGPLLGAIVPWSAVNRILHAPKEQGEAGLRQKTYLESKLPTTLTELEDLSPKERITAVRVAAMFAVKACRPEPVLSEWDLEDWFRPDAKFLNGWRRDQLDAYARKLGKPMKVAGEGAPDKKADQVKHILDAIAAGAVPVPPLPMFFDETPVPPPEDDGDESGDEDEHQDDDEESAEDDVGVPPKPGKGDTAGVTAKPPK